MLTAPGRLLLWTTWKKQHTLEHTSGKLRSRFKDYLALEGALLRCAGIDAVRAPDDGELKYRTGVIRERSWLL